MESRYWSLSLMALGAVMVATSLWHLLHEFPPSVDLHFVADLVLIGGSGLAVLYGGLWHRRSDVGRGQELRLLGWLLGGALLFTSVMVVSLFVGSQGVTFTELLEVVHLTISVGMATGLGVGTVEATAIAESRAAARAEAATAALEREQERVFRINELLRHYVLNSLTVIGGHVDRYGETDSVDTVAVDERIDTVETLVEHIRALSTALREDSPLTDYEPGQLVRSTLAEIDPEQTVVVDIDPDAPSIRAPVSFERALGLLFEALLERQGSDDSLDVTLTESADDVSIQISSDLTSSSAGEPFAAVGPQADLKFTLAREFIDSAGTLRLGDEAPAGVFCSLTVGRARVEGDESQAARGLAHNR